MKQYISDKDINLYSRCTATDARIAYEIADKFKKTKATGDNEIDFFYVLGTIYQAGHIEGIRQERAKRKAKATV